MDRITMLLGAFASLSRRKKVFHSVALALAVVLAWLDTHYSLINK
jgi:hypothetical protein